MRANPKSWMERVVSNRVMFLVLAMIVIVPLDAAPAEGHIHGAAAMAFDIFGLLLLIALLWSAKWKFTKSSMSTFFTTGANLPILLLSGLAIASCVTSTQWGYSIPELLRLQVGVLLYFVVAYQFRRSTQLARLADTLMFVALAASAIGFVQYGTSETVQANGLFQDHQLFGSFLMLQMPLLAVLSLVEKSLNRRLAAQAATILTGTCLFLTHATGAWIGAACGLTVICLMLLSAGKRSGQWTERRHKVVAPAVAFLVAVSLFLVLAPRTGGTGVPMKSAPATDQKDTWTFHQSTWASAVHMVRERPLTGWGLGLYPYYERRYTRDAILSDLFNAQIALGDQAHSLYLQTAAELGIPGLVLLVASVGTFLVTGIRHVRMMKSGSRRNLLLGSIGSVIAISVDALSSSSWQVGQISMFLWLMLGLGAGAMRPTHAVTDPEQRSSARSNRWSWVAALRPMPALVTNRDIEASEPLGTPHTISTRPT